MEHRPRLLEYLSGTGLEIGALHRPVDAPHLKVSYVDRLSKAQALEHYPELIPHSDKIVEPGIIDDAETLATVSVSSQDFLIANHVIEHMRNPIVSLMNWCRVLRPGGRLFLAVPFRDGTFDRERELTPFSHLLQDYEDPSEERDFQHFLDFSLYVSCRFFNVKPENESVQFAQELWEKRYSIHYHVWNFETFQDFLSQMQSRFGTLFPMKMIDSVAPTSDEFLFVLEKAT